MPGCYPTSVILGVLPLVEEKCLIKTLLADCKSGVSGAGRSASSSTIYGEVAENFKAYAVHGRRHLPEIKQEVIRIANKSKENLILTISTFSLLLICYRCLEVYILLSM